MPEPSTAASLLRPCSTSAGFTATPEPALRMDMPRLKATLLAAGYTIVADARIILIVRHPAGPTAATAIGAPTTTPATAASAANTATAATATASRIARPAPGPVESSVYDNGKVLLKTTDRSAAEAAYDDIAPRVQSCAR